MKSVITQKQKEILCFITKFIGETGYSPTIREIMTELGFASPRSVDYHLGILESNNLISRSSQKRGITVEDVLGKSGNYKTRLIPLLGAVSCGSPIWSEQNFEDYYPVSEKLLKNKDRVFLVRAIGDSMNLEGIDNGDFVLINAQDDANNGDIVVAMVNDGVTIKKFNKQGHHVILKPSSTNPQHKPIILDKDSRIQGKVVDVINNLDTPEG